MLPSGIGVKTSMHLKKGSEDLVENPSTGSEQRKKSPEIIVMDLLTSNRYSVFIQGCFMSRKGIVIGMILLVVVVGLSGCQDKENNTTNTDQEEFSVNEFGGIVSILDEKVVFTVPSDAVYEQTIFTVKTAENIPSDENYVTGTAYEFGPDGFQFNESVQLTITYDPNNIPAGAQESHLMLAKLVSGSWKIINDSSADTTTHTVTGSINSFCKYGVVMDTEKVRITPYAATCTATGIVVLEARLLGYPAGYEPQYTWTFSGTNGRIVIDPADYSKVTYVANGDATENSVDTINLEVGATFADESHEEGTPYEWGRATATVTIKKTTVEIQPSPASCAPGETVVFTAVVSNPPDYTIQYIWTSPGSNGELVDVDPSKKTVSYKADSGAIDGGTDTIKVELWTTFVDDYHEKGATHKWAEATVIVTIQKLSLSINPTTAECPPGGDVDFTAIIVNAPIDYVFSYKWTCSCAYGTLEGITPNYHLMTYTANDAAIDGGTDRINVELWTNFGGANAYKWAEATATVTIQKLSLSIDPTTDECTPNGQVQFTALLNDFPETYDYEFRWTCTNNNGGLVADSPGNNTIYYKANANAVIGSIDTVNVELWTIFEDADHVKTPYKWANATATVSITTSPLTEYSLVNANGGEIHAGGSDLVVYRVGYGMIDYHSFQARPGEQLRIMCNDRGYKEDYENKDIYLKKGTTMTLLVTWDELPDDDDPKFDKTFTLD
jgi:hypothetical protein